MSLHQKIVALFIVVAILPLLIFAGMARQLTLDLADFAAETELVQETVTASRILDQEAAVARGALRGFAAVPGHSISSELLSQVLASEAGPQPGGFQFLEVRRADGTSTARAGALTDTLRCEGGRYSALVSLDVPLEDGTGTLHGAYWAGQEPGLRAGQGLWVYDEAGRLVMGTTCGTDSGVSPSQVPPDSLSGLLADDGGAAANQGQSVAFARVAGEGWVALATGVSPLRGSVARFFRSYWLFVLGLAGTTLLAFSVLLRRVTGSLEDLTRAAERVAQGDLNPWLPTPTDDEIGRLTLAFSEMTDRLRSMVAQVDRSSRLAVLGKLSAFLAHEIRNPLSTVKMNLQRLQRWQEAGELPSRCETPIDVSLKEVGRLSAAVSNILQLSPGKVRPTEVVSVHELVEEVGQLLDQDFTRRGVSLRWELNAEADRVLAQPGQLKGVVINLMLNALDAQPDGGELLIRSRLRPPGAGQQGPRLELRFKDRGTGVPEGVRGRVFEPFFTTKEGGSGIGLAVASQTIRDHGGELFLEEPSTLEEGAEFVVSLPLAARVQEWDPGETEPQVAPWMEGPAPG
ncbi:MAG TPA: ATP-binding protein [Longimicrobiales bacterium]|nr:ATP-binding protein [Longimicrobiales bacterium]